jgi:dTDP-4-amino-4,6-dideoxygalactose transaminase
MTASRAVPFADLALQHRRIAAEVWRGFDRVVENTAFVQGPDVLEFEREFATYCGVGNVVGVANGTDALELALRASGVGSGDEVIVPTNTFVATAEAVLRAGASVVFADCDENYLIDVDDVAGLISPRTRAIIAVHLYGQCAPVERLRPLAAHDIVLVEDAAQSQGARRFGRRAGALGDIAGTSFYPGKNLGAYGDGGAVMTDDPRVARAVRELGSHGGIGHYEHRVAGMNSRLDTLQAVVLRAKLALLDDWNSERRAAAALYDRLLEGVEGVVTPAVADGNEHVYHLYVVRVPDRDRVLAALQEDGVGAGIHYPAPVHLLPPFRNGQANGSAHATPRPRAERYAREILSLPIFPGITVAQQEYVVERLAAALGVRVSP